MKSLSISVVAMATSLFVLCTSFSDRQIAGSETAAAARVGNLFWYIDDGTVYNDWTSVDNETTEMEDEYGVLVDTDPVGGTIVSIGYPVYGLPHDVYPSCYLYAHF